MRMLRLAFMDSGLSPCVINWEFLALHGMAKEAVGTLCSACKARTLMHTQALASLATVAGAWAERASSDPDSTLFRQVRLSAANHSDCVGPHTGCLRSTLA